MGIRFSDKCAMDFETDSISFEAFSDGKRIVCKISHEGIEDNFINNDNCSMMDIFKANREEIEQIAKLLIAKNRFDKDGFVRIYSADFNR